MVCSSYAHIRALASCLVLVVSLLFFFWDGTYTCISHQWCKKKIKFDEEMRKRHNKTNYLIQMRRLKYTRVRIKFQCDTTTHNQTQHYMPQLYDAQFVWTLNYIVTTHRCWWRWWWYWWWLLLLFILKLNSRALYTHMMKNVDIFSCWSE